MKLGFALMVSFLVGPIAHAKAVTIEDLNKSFRYCMLETGLLNRIHAFAIPESPSTGHKLRKKITRSHWSYVFEEFRRVYPGYQFDLHSYRTDFRMVDDQLWTYHVYDVRHAYKKNEYRQIWLAANKFPHLTYEASQPIYDKYGDLAEEKSVVTGLKIANEATTEVVMVNPKTLQPTELSLDLRPYVDCLASQIRELE